MARGGAYRGSPSDTAAKPEGKKSPKKKDTQKAGELKGISRYTSTVNQAKSNRWATMVLLEKGDIVWKEKQAPVGQDITMTAAQPRYVRQQPSGRNRVERMINGEKKAIDKM